MAKLLIHFLSVLILASYSFASPELDEYGGYAAIPIEDANLGHWGTTKIGNRWVMVTPAGNAFISLGVYSLGEGTGADDTGTYYQDYWATKYSSDAPDHCTNQLKRLRNWGFNSMADYAYLHCKGYSAIGSVLPNRSPAFAYPVNGADYSRRNVDGLITGNVKEIVRPCNDNYIFYGSKVVDYFDPRFAEYIDARLQASYSSTVGDPYLIGLASDESDNTYGFNSGGDFAADRVDPHLGLVAAVCPPTQTAEPDGGWTYTDTETYTKTALKDFLIAKYTTIEALNTAWGSDYTTFESDGGWETGSGFLDEDGRTAHKAWLGADNTLNDGSCNANVKIDLDNFLYEIATHYFKTYYDLINLYYPDVLQAGPMTIGSWGAPPRAQVIQAAAPYLDLFRSGLKEPDLQEKIDFTIEHLGKEMLMIAWVGTHANADSGLHTYPDDGELLTQEARGAYYADKLNDLMTTPTSAGSYVFAGLQYWEWTDHWNEETNWGLVTVRDNAYDGVEAVVAVSQDSDGWNIGGEDYNYGDFITGVTDANNGVFDILMDEIRAGRRVDLSGTTKAVLTGGKSLYLNQN